jgi:N-acetylglutamate synthase-like GNAT family acetyltransferase
MLESEKSAEPARPAGGSADRVTFRAQLIACADCHELFTWSAKEQEFFAAQGFQPPKRCQPCRGKKRERYGKRI